MGDMADDLIQDGLDALGMDGVCEHGYDGPCPVCDEEAEEEEGTP